MTATAFPPRRTGSPRSRPHEPVSPRHTTTLRPRRHFASEEEALRTDRARMEEAAIEAGRWLRRTGRLSLPVRPRR